LGNHSRDHPISDDDGHPSKVPTLPLSVSVSLTNKEKEKLAVIQEASMHSYGSGSSHPVTPQVVIKKAASPKGLKSNKVDNQLEDLNSSQRKSNRKKPNNNNDRSIEKLLSPDDHNINPKFASKRLLRPVSADSKRLPLLLHVVDMADFR